MLKFMGIAKMLGWASLLLGLTVGCTRQQSDSANLSISIPNASKPQGQSSTDNLKLKHLVINVTGSGITTPGYFLWQGCSDCANPPTVPQDIELQIPSGAARLIQVLAVYDNLDRRSTMLYYGDLTEDLTTDKSVKIPVEDLLGNMDLASGNISGRILDSADSGPTGVINIKYQPPNKPALIIDKGLMMSGWFSVFGLRGISFRYELENGRDLFGGAVDLNSPVFQPSANRVKFIVPVHANQRENNQVLNSEEAEISVLGYFGSPDVIQGKRICHDLAEGENSPFLKYNSSTTKLTYHVSSTTTEPANLFNRQNPPTQVTVQGGESSLSSSCTGLLSGTDTLYHQFLALLKNNIGRGKDVLPGFVFPYAFTDGSAAMKFGGPQLMAFDMQGTSLGLRGRFLPGVQKMITKVKLYSLPESYVRPENSDVAPCGELSSEKNPFGAVSSGDAPVNTSNGIFSLQSSWPTSKFMTGKLAALCFQRPDGSSYAFGSWIHNSGSGSGPTGPYLRAEVRGGYWIPEQQVHGLVKNECYQVQLNAYEPSSGVATAHTMNAAVSVTGLADFSAGKFYDGTDCQGSSISEVQIPAGSSSSSLFSFQAQNTTAGSALNLTVSQNEVSYSPAMIGVEAVQLVLGEGFQSAVVQNLCYTTEARLKAWGRGHIPQSAIPVSLLIPSGLEVYEDSSQGCSASVINQLNFHGIGSTTFSFKAVNSATMHLNGTSAAIGQIIPLTLNVTSGSPHIARVDVEMPANLQVGVCAPVSMTLRNSQGIQISAPWLELTELPIESQSGLRFYADPMCNQITNTVIFPAGRSMVTAYVLLNQQDFNFRLGTNLDIQLFGGMSQVNGMIHGSAGAGSAPYLSLSPPLLHSRILGSHNFSSIEYGGIPIPINAPADAQLECSSGYGSVWGSCDSFVVNRNLVWTEDRALMGSSQMDRVLWVRNRLTGQQVRFDPYQVYGNDFRVVNCDVVVATTGGSVDPQDVITNLNLEKKVCLPKDSVVTLPSSQTFNLSAGRALIGYRDLSSKIVKTDTGSASAIEVSGAINTVTIANLSLQYSATNGYAVTVLPAVSGGGRIEVKGLVIQGTLPGMRISDVTALYQLEVEDIHFQRKLSFGPVPPASPSAALLIQNSVIGSEYSTASFRRLNFVSDVPNAISISLDGNSTDQSYARVAEAYFDNYGTAVNVTTAAGGPNSTLEIERSQFHRAPASTETTPLLIVGSNAELRLWNSDVRNAAAPAYLIYMWAGSGTVKVRDSVLVQESDSPIISSAGTLGANTVVLDRNQFVIKHSGTEPIVLADALHGTEFLGQDANAAAGNRVCRDASSPSLLPIAGQYTGGGPPLYQTSVR